MKTHLTLILLLISIAAFSQSVGVGTRTPDSSAVLDVKSTTKGLLLPRMTTAQRERITSPAIGLTVFDLDNRTYWYYTGTEWVEMTTNKEEENSHSDGNSRVNEDWNTQGNSNVGGEFIGTTNNQPLLFKTNGNERMRIQGNGNLGIGNSAPHALLHLQNAHDNRKLIVNEVADNDHQFYGLGSGTNMFRYQVGATSGSHAFFAGVNGTTSNELMRITGTGNLGIGTQNPQERLEVGGNGRAFFGDGQGNARKGLLIDGIEGTNASRLEAYDYSLPGGRNLVINTIGGGYVGINNPNPHAPLQFSNDGGSRKIVLWELADNIHQYSGFGIDPFVLRYNVQDDIIDHVFYAGTTDTTSSELMRIKGNGNVGIDASEPKERLEVGGSGRAFFGDGQGDARKGLLIDGIEGTNASRLEAYDYSIPGGRNLVINTIGGGFVGINNPSPHAPLQFSNDGPSRKIVLWELADNIHQYSGFGIDPFILRYNVQDDIIDHVFYAGTTDTTSSELMRIKGNGNVGIDASDPQERLEVGGGGRAFFGDGAGIDRSGLLIDGIDINNSSRIEAYNYDGETGRNLIINTHGGGNVGIGLNNPTEKLHVNGNIKVEGSIINEGWHTVDQFFLGWEQAEGYAPVGFYKDKENRVHLRGMLNFYDSFTPYILGLPEGYRPAYDQFFAGYNSVGSFDVCAFKVTAGGSVEIESASFGLISLDQISFRAEQ